MLRRIPSVMEGLPKFNVHGDLPPGIHRVPLATVIERFGEVSAGRRVLGKRLRRLFVLANDTGHLARFIV
jgi:hypothetical protein